MKLIPPPWSCTRNFIFSALAVLFCYWALPFSPVSLVVLGLCVFAFLTVSDTLIRFIFRKGRSDCFELKRVIKNSLVLLAFFSALVIGKVIWCEQLRLSGEEVLTGSALPQLLERRNFLMKRVVQHPFSPKDIPSLIKSPFREELTIATYSMTSLALANLAYAAPETREESVEAIASLIERMLTKEVRRYEVLWWKEDALDTLDGKNGHVGYLGHLNLMFGLYRLLGGDTRYDELHKKVTDALAYRATLSPSYHIETFPGAIFTADNTLSMVSIQLWGRIHRAKYDGLFRNFILFTKRRLLDSESGMVRYHVTAGGRAAGAPRGVLQAWNSMFLPFLNKKFAAEQYAIMKERLFDQAPLFSLAGIREYEKGKEGQFDAISGPVVFGISGSATGFAIGGARFQQDTQTLTELLRTSEFVGSTTTCKDKRFYLLGPLVGEAIVLAGQSMVDFDTRYVVEEGRQQMVPNFGGM